MKSLLASTLILAACGGTGSEFDPGAGDAKGTGTSTLTVNGSARARPRATNALDATQFDTELSVDVQLNGVEVTTGTVEVTSATGKVTLTYNGGGGGNNGRWQGTATGYDEVYKFDVISGTDTVKGVRVDGPDFHTFTKPAAGATLDSTIDNPIAWDRSDTADSATIRTELIDTLAIPDTGKYTIPVGGIRAERDVAHMNTIRINRTNSVVPAGATGGSEFVVSVENSIDVLAAPNPAL